ncbi:uncharacterized protein THITE_2089695 [Thermothielavioides terrestris NRRL 8126]|uniref:2EXR domain-containing protein n=1 Tax=Thermothielavioides terrestris (strain ATCC 38088 / NRRL 8126) TaxID=578455 RepID=G2R8E3_THETT|nr:uncharacterized protein THITE_2089695 [Thermothielavioides terrestris NRRL 8126]AEO68201.1 hypothetical protein THITE_2089695 [Thermothielavioides terrestris NRRL 8126]
MVLVELLEKSLEEVTLTEKKRAPADENTNELELKVEAALFKAADAADQLFNKKANPSRLEVEKTEMSAALKAEQAKCREAKPLPRWTRKRHSTLHVKALDAEKRNTREHAARGEGRRIHGRATRTPPLAPRPHRPHSPRWSKYVAPVAAGSRMSSSRRAGLRTTTPISVIRLPPPCPEMSEDSTSAPPPFHHAPETTTFHHFRRLPPELRLRIWEFCLPRRIIPLSMLVILHKHAQQHTAAQSIAHSDPPDAGSNDDASANPKHARSTADRGPKPELNEENKPPGAQRHREQHSQPCSSFPSKPCPCSKLIRATLSRPTLLTQISRESRAVALARRRPVLSCLTGTGPGSDASTSTTMGRTSGIASGNGKGHENGSSDSSSSGSSNEGDGTGTASHRYPCHQRAQRRCPPGWDQAWIDPRTDTLLVDCDIGTEHRAIWEQLREHLPLMLPGCGGGERGGGPRQGAGVGISVRAWHWMESAMSWISADSKLDGSRLGAGGRPQVDVVLLEVELDLTAADARASGLFGLLGEDRAVFVPLSDRRQLERLFKVQDRRLWGQDLRLAVRSALASWMEWHASEMQGPGAAKALLRRTRCTAAGFDIRPVVHVQWSDLAGPRGVV